MSFAKAQARWEESWINGPAEDPLEQYFDEIADWSDEQLREEHRSLGYSLRYPEPGDRVDVVERMLNAIEYELRERGEII